MTAKGIDSDNNLSVGRGADCIINHDDVRTEHNNNRISEKPKRQSITSTAPTLVKRIEDVKARLHKVSFCRGSAHIVIDKTFLPLLGLKVEDRVNNNNNSYRGNSSYYVQQTLTAGGLLINFLEHHDGALLEQNEELIIRHNQTTGSRDIKNDDDDGIVDDYYYPLHEDIHEKGLATSNRETTNGVNPGSNNDKRGDSSQ